MLTALKQSFGRLSLMRQFMLAIISILTIGVVVIGLWIAHQIETSAVRRATEISAIYLESISAPELRGWKHGEIVDPETHADLDRLFIYGPLHREVLRFKLWDASGRIDYSSDHAQMGLRFPIRGRLASAFAGTVQGRISQLKESDNLPEQAQWKELLEVYVPIRSHDHPDQVIAVAEFYLSVDKLKQDIRAAQMRSWGLVVISLFATFLLLFGLVRRASNTINDQQRDLRQQLEQLRSLLDENDRMREQLREAGVSTTTLNEEFLLRIAADLHDGPAQTLAFALMRFDEFAATCHFCTTSPQGASQELQSIHGALQSSLRDVRKISSGLAVPGLAELSLANAARRAVSDFEHTSGQTVQSHIDGTLGNAPLSVKITVYRLLQESLSNCWRHAHTGAPQVHVQRSHDEVLITITDQGAGFDPQAAAVGGRLGLAFMRERVRLLGGIFEIESSPGHGTRISARLPLSTDEMIHD